MNKEIKDWDLREELVEVVVDLDISDVEVISSTDSTSHLLTLCESEGVGELSRGGNRAKCEGYDGKLDIKFIETTNVQHEN